MFGVLAAKRQQYVATVFPCSASKNEEFMDGIGYIHLLGDSKHNKIAIHKVEEKLQQNHPWLYDVVKSLGLKKQYPRSGQGYGYSS
jgi:hypothetical protein